MLYLGTSGFGYKDWVGVFYPSGMPRREWLPYYCREFNTCEITSTFQELPQPSAVAALVEKSSPGFLFTVKAHHRLTHHRDDSRDALAAFRRAISPLVESGKLGCVIAQFPYSFVCQPENLDYLLLLRERLGELPVAVEFRHPSWLRQPILEWLRRQKLACCYALSEERPPVYSEKVDIAYIRLQAIAEEGETSTPASVEPSLVQQSVPWVNSISVQAEKTFIFAGNWARGGSIFTMRRLKSLLGKDVTSENRAEVFPPRFRGNRR